MKASLASVRILIDTWLSNISHLRNPPSRLLMQFGSPRPRRRYIPRACVAVLTSSCKEKMRKEMVNTEIQQFVLHDDIIFGKSKASN